MTNRPRPAITEENRPYWDAMKRQEIRLQCCGNCGHIRPVPADLCPRCLSEETEWKRMKGTGTISSWCVYERAFHPAFEGRVPYAIVQADLDEGVRFVAPLRDLPAEPLRLGQPIRIGFEVIDDALTLPVMDVEPVGR